MRFAARIRRPVVGGAVTAIALPLLLLPNSSLTAHADEGDACRPEVQTNEASSAELEEAAVDLAVACGIEVNVLEHTTEYSSVTALPTGVLRFETTGTAERALVADEWHDIDLTLEPVDGGDLKPAVSAADVRFSSGGDAPFVTMTGDDGATFSLSWPDALPDGIVDGSSVTYPDVMPDVDLVVTAEPSGFSHVVVVHTPEAAENPDIRRIGLITTGTAELSQGDEGRMTLTGPGGVLAESIPPVAWDSTGTDNAGVAASSASQAGEDALVVPIDVSIADGELQLEPDERLFDEGAYPLYIDPKWEKSVGSGAYWGYANDGNRNCTVGNSNERAAVGSIPADGALDCYGLTFRSLFTFTGAGTFAGNRILSEGTKFDIILNHTYHCSGTQPVWLYRTGASISSNGQRVAWSSASLSKYLDRVDAPSAHCGNPTRALSFSGSNLLSDLRSHSGSTYSVALSARDTSGNGETIQERWKKFQHQSARLTVMYEHRPTAPVAVRTAPGGACVTSAPGPWINDRNPTLYGQATDDDGTVRIEFDLNGSTSPANHTSAWTTSRSERGWSTPTLNEGNYQWRVRGTDNVDSTDWTGYCHFRLDHTPPDVPTVERISSEPVDGEPVTLRFSSQDSRSGIARFAYGLGGDVPEETVTSSGQSSVTFTPEAGRQIVYVWAVDQAGNWSKRGAYNFVTKRILAADAAGVWRMDGDARDDSGSARDLTVSDLSFGPDRHGYSDAAIYGDGTGCAYTDEAAIRTDMEFTVAAWVKLRSSGTYTAMLAHSTEDRSNFQVQYEAASDRWFLSRVTDPTGEVKWNSFGAPSQVGMGEWQHIAVTSDPIAGVTRLYLDGSLAAEHAAGFNPWHVAGRLSIGCVARQDGTLIKQIDGAVDHVGVWQGLLTEEQIQNVMGELPAGRTGYWQFQGDGEDSSGFGHHLQIPPGVDYVSDQFGRVNAAVSIPTDECLSTESPVVDTTRSYSIAAWARPGDNGDTRMSVVSQAGEFRAAVRLMRYEDGYWYLSTAAADTQEEPAWRSIRSANQATGSWQHIAVTFNASTVTYSFYVDGELQGTLQLEEPPWQSSGPLFIGCQRSMGSFIDQYTGLVSNVQMWRGVVTGSEITSLYGGNPAVELQASWAFEGPESDSYTGFADSSGNGHELTSVGNYEWTRDRANGRDGALGLPSGSGSCATSAGSVVNTTGSFTVALWVKPQEAAGRTMVILSQGGTQRDGFRLQYSGISQRWEFLMPRYDLAGHAQDQVATSSSIPAADVWVHLAGVYDKRNGELRLYVNGQLEATVHGVTSFDARSGLRIGGASYLGEPAMLLSGAVDSVNVWSSTLHPDRIADLAAA